MSFPQTLAPITRFELAVQHFLVSLMVSVFDKKSNQPGLSSCGILKHLSVNKSVYSLELVSTPRVSNTPLCQIHLVLKTHYCIKHPVTQVNTPFTKAHLVVATPLVSKHICDRHPLCQTRNIHCFKHSPVSNNLL